MIFLKRKRLIFWLLRAYIKKWGKTIIFSFIFGLGIFILIFLNRSFFISQIQVVKSENIGLVAIPSKSGLPNSLPEIVLNQISRGLTKVDSTGKVLWDIAKRWEIKDDGRMYIFYLRSNIYFSDGKLVDSSSINYNFDGFVVEKPSREVIVFKLKDKYSPFLVTLSNYKVFKRNNVGVSEYKIDKVKTNAGFVDYVELKSSKNNKIIKYDFYETQDALKSAYVLGEVTKIIDINNLDYKKKINLASFNNTSVSKEINSEKIVSIFFNNQDPLLSDKKIRKALAYSLTNKFPEGERTYTPYSPDLWANDKTQVYEGDLEYSKLLLSQSESSKSGTLKIELKTLPQYEDLAERISKDWKKLGVNTDIKTVDGVPELYQAFLGEFPVLKDPDQYTLWHTGQSGNITNYRNLRIDKLLEDGRRIYDKEERRKIYADFQKYLLDDMPVIFLYFPYTYSLSRK